MKLDSTTGRLHRTRKSRAKLQRGRRPHRIRLSLHSGSHDKPELGETEYAHQRMDRVSSVDLRFGFTMNTMQASMVSAGVTPTVLIDAFDALTLPKSA